MKYLLISCNLMLSGFAVIPGMCINRDKRQAVNQVGFIPAYTVPPDTLPNLPGSDTTAVFPLKQEPDESGSFTCGSEQPPQFPGGTKAMYRFIEKNLRIPDDYRESGIYVRVFLDFIVEKTGEISQIRVIRGLRSDCDQEAVRLVKSMPKWIPGEQGGSVVQVRFNLPITFSRK